MLAHDAGAFCHDYTTTTGIASCKDDKEVSAKISSDILNQNSSSNENVKDARSKLFFTTSDLIKRINSTIHEDESAAMGSKQSGGFELQRRFPDGTTRKADESDVSSVDFHSKMKQAATLVSTLSPEKKIEWATNHRQRGNTLFQNGDYKEAIDVYLTCLVAIESGSDSLDDKNERNDHEDTNLKNQQCKNRADEEIKLPVLLNLSACTLKMGMYKKTEQFCTIAMEIPIGKKSVKAHFRRGRARMLMCSYNSAREDFEFALGLLSSTSERDNACDKQAREEEAEAVRCEMVKLRKVMEMAQKNKTNYKIAMKKVLGGNETVAKNDNADSALALENTAKLKEQNSITPGLYQDVTKRRAYSTLRAKSKKDIANKDYQKVHNTIHEESSYTAWYISMVERCLRRILYLLGDEDAMTRSFEELDEVVEKEKNL